MNKIFVARLPWATCKEALKNHFSKFGSVKDCYVVMDKATKRSKGFGFVTFAEEDSANKAISTENEIDGRKIVVNMAIQKDTINNKPQSDESN